MAFDAYKKEKAVLDHAETVLAEPERADFASEYHVLYQSYTKLYKLLRRLVTISDRLQQHLKEANQTIDRQHKELAAAHDDLSSRNLDLEMKVNEFESIFNNSAMGIALLAPDGSFDRVNKRLCELLEESSEAVREHKLQDYLFDGETRQGKEIGLSCPEPGAILQLERRLKTATGRVFFASLSGKALNPAQMETGCIWLIDDITHRKELENLQADVQRIMQHDLKGPLNGIISLPGIVAQEGNLTRDQLALLDDITTSGRKMLKQIELSHDIYAMETGSYAFYPRPVDIVSVVRTVVQEHQIMAKHRGVSLVSQFCGRELGQDDRFVGALDELLSCVMLGNIVKNAIEASKPGEAVRITLEADECLLLAVHNAKPVSSNVLPIFFDKYVTFGKEGGTGLGTYSAYLMAKTQGCGLDVVSNKTDGTVVTFTIPRY